MTDPCDNCGHDVSRHTRNKFRCVAGRRSPAWLFRCKCPGFQPYTFWPLDTTSLAADLVGIPTRAGEMYTVPASEQSNVRVRRVEPDDEKDRAVASVGWPAGTEFATSSYDSSSSSDSSSDSSSSFDSGGGDSGGGGGSDSW